MNIQFIIGFVTAALIGMIIFLFCILMLNKKKNVFIEDLFRIVNVIENTKDFIYYYQLYPKKGYRYLSPSAENIFGKGSIERVLRDPEIPFKEVHPDDYEILMKKARGEIDFSKSIVQRWKDMDGIYRWFEEYATPIYENGRLVAMQGVIRNIDEKIKLQEELQYRMNHDVLTGIYNREYFEKEIDRFNEITNTSIGVILCDLDNLKYTNDHLGHKTGDVLIKETAQLLNKLTSNNITVSRIGGDEFILLAIETTDDGVNQLVENILIDINTYNKSDHELKISLSIGYAFSSNSIGQMPVLFSQADKNMYIDKMSKKQITV